MVDVHGQWTGGPHVDRGTQPLPYRQQMWPLPADNQHNMYTLSFPNVTQQSMVTVWSIGQASGTSPIAYSSPNHMGMSAHDGAIPNTT